MRAETRAHRWAALLVAVLLSTSFLTCTSPGEVLALQERVDMPRLLEALDDWSAVRLGALGPPREDIARQLNEKRKSLLVKAPEAYGRLNAQVLAVYSVDSAYDDDLREILFLLAQDKRLAETLALLPAFQVALEKYEALEAQMKMDAREALRNYGQTLDIRRPGLVGPVEVQRVHLIYEGGKLTPTDVDASKAAALATEKAVPGVEVLFQ